jgi:hypothetical protein
MWIPFPTIFFFPFPLSYFIELSAFSFELILPFPATLHRRASPDPWTLLF